MKEIMQGGEEVNATSTAVLLAVKEEPRVLQQFIRRKSRSRGGGTR